jgi:hypothetical protein
VSDFRQLENDKETTMTKGKNLAGKSGYSNSFALTVAAIAICCLILEAAVLAPSGAASDISTTTAYADSTDDFPDQFVNFPDQFVNQPEQILMMMYYFD